MEEKKKFIVNTAFIGIIIGLLFLVYKYLLPIVLPFIIGFVFAYIAHSITKRISKNNNKYIKCVVLVLLYCLVAIAGFIITVKAIDQIVEFIKSLPSFYNNVLLPAFDNILTNLEESFSNSDVDFKIVKDYINTFVSSLSSSVTTIANKTVSIITALAKKTPEVIVSTIVCIVTSFYFVLDYDALVHSIGSIFNEKTRKTIRDFEYFLSHKFIKIIGTYLIIMFITYVELFVGFGVLKIQSPYLLAAVVAIVDIMPVLGVGTVLIPWGAVEIIIGNSSFGVKILVLYVIITIIRNIIEPKMVGDGLKLHPLLTLFTMMVGLNVFGILGMIGIPLVISFINNQKEESESKKNVKKEK